MYARGYPSRPLSTTVALLFALFISSASSEDSYILIKGGTVVNHDRRYQADVLIKGELIDAVGTDLQAPEGARIIDATGSYLMPGGIDPHTHLDMPFMGQVACDDYFSGQAAALAGGTTTHIDFALPIGHDLIRGFKEWQVKAEKACTDYSFHMAVTNWDDKVSRDMGELVKEGIASFKFFMAYKNALMVNDDELIQGMVRCKELGALVMVHAENGEAVAWGQSATIARGITGPEGHGLSRPPAVEGEATSRAIRLAGVVGVPLYVVHVMSIDALEEVARARASGQRVIGEPVASGLALDESHTWSANFTHAAQYVMSPPLRAPHHKAALKKALASGVLQVVATDHAVFNSTQKALGGARHDFRLIPNGVNGIEERMHVVWQEMVVSGLATPSDYVRMTSTAAAQVFGLYPRKGLLAAGSDADVIVLDPRIKHTLGVGSHHSRMDTNVYEGKDIQGKVVVTVSRGRVVWENDQLNVTAGTGRFLKRPAFGPLYEGLQALHDQAYSSPYGPTPVCRSGDACSSSQTLAPQGTCGGEPGGDATGVSGGGTCSMPEP